MAGNDEDFGGLTSTTGGLFFFGNNLIKRASISLNAKKYDDVVFRMQMFFYR